MFQSLTIFDFLNRFLDDKSSQDYVCEFCRKDSFVFPKYSNPRYCKGDREHDRQYTKCKHKVPPTWGTLFDRIKISFFVRPYYQQEIDLQPQPQPQADVTTKDVLAIQAEGYAGHETVLRRHWFNQHRMNEAIFDNRVLRIFVIKPYPDEMIIA